MPPASVKKGSAKKKQRVNISECALNNWTEIARVDRYVVIYPGTQMICGGCYSSVEDMSQHVNKASCCAVYLALRHVKVAYHENVIAHMPNVDVENPPPLPFEDAIVSVMLQDEACILNAKDILAMPATWNPTVNFYNSATTGQYGHILAENLCNRSFVTIYQDYLNRNRQYQNFGVPDIWTEAVNSANTVRALPSWLTRYWNYFAKKFAEESEDEEGGAQQEPRSLPQPRLLSQSP